MFSHRSKISALLSRKLFSRFLQRKFSQSPRICSPEITSKQTTNELVNIDVDQQTKIATLTLSRPPANALSSEMMARIIAAVEELENRKVLGIILTSSVNRIFCGGIDLNELHARDVDSLTKLWTSFQNVWRTLFASRLPIAALINGHALGGGCMLTNCSDYRAILPNRTIGVNATRAGIVVPFWLMDSYLNAVSSRRIAEADLISGRTYKSEDALNVGLVDVVVDSTETGLSKCREFLSSYNRPTHEAMAQTKVDFRAGILENFDKNREKDLNQFLKIAQTSEFQTFIGSYLKGLK